jgi:hypothetical protein
MGFSVVLEADLGKRSGFYCHGAYPTQQSCTCICRCFVERIAQAWMSERHRTPNAGNHSRQVDLTGARQFDRDAKPEAKPFRIIVPARLKQHIQDT